MLLKKLLENDLIHFEESFDNWEDSIRGNAKQLIKNGYIDDQYAEAVISCVNKYGPYIVIIPNVAMPHSTEGAPGVSKTGIGFMKVEQPVSFTLGDETKDAVLFFMLAALDHEEHLGNISALMDLLMNEDLLNELLVSKNIEDIKVLVEKYSD